MRRACAVLAAALTTVLIGGSACARQAASPGPVSRGYAIPLIDLAEQTERQVVVDREPGQYLGHPTTVLLEDGRTLLTVYPKGHGRGPIVLKRSPDGRTLAALLRENSRRRNSCVIFWKDEGQT